MTSAARSNYTFLKGYSVKYLKSAVLSLVCVFCLFLVMIIAAGAVCVHRTINLPEPGAVERVIIFAEINSSIFEVENRDTGGMDIETLFSDEVIAILADRSYEMSLAVDDFDDPTTVRVIRRLNDAGIPVWIWPLHPMEDGYWLATDNANKMPGLYERFQRWVDENDLVITGVMFDMEPTYDDVQGLKEVVREGGIPGAVSYLLTRRDGGLHTEAVRIYTDMVETIRADGYEVSTFNYPYLIDDRKDGDDSIAEMFHVAFVDSDIDAYMTYRSFFKDSGLGTGSGNVASYAVELSGGSASLGSYMKDYLDETHLEADMRIAARTSPVVHLYNLEALVMHGWLEGLSEIDLAGPVEISVGEAAMIFGYRTFFFLLDLFTGESRIFAWPLVIVLWGLCMGLVIRRKKKTS